MVVNEIFPSTIIGFSYCLILICRKTERIRQQKSEVRIDSLGGVCLLRSMECLNCFNVQSFESFRARLGRQNAFAEKKERNALALITKISVDQNGYFTIRLQIPARENLPFSFSYLTNKLLLIIALLL